MPNRSKIFCAPLAAGFPDRLVAARKAAALTQQVLGVAVGYAPTSARQAIDGLEKGRFRGSLEVAEALAKILGVHPAWLAYGKGPRRVRSCR